MLATFSRSGLIFVGLSAVFVLFGRIGIRASNWRTALAYIGGLATIGALVFLSGNIVGRVSERYVAVDDDGRWQFWVTSWGIIKDYFPLGSGLGSFVPVYAKYEPLAAVTSAYVNHAHNDYLELVLETGIAGLSIILMAVAVLLANVIRHKSWNKIDLVVVSQWIVFLVLAHSIVDYPMRTQAFAAVFGLFAAIMLKLSGTRESSSPSMPAMNWSQVDSDL